VGNLQHIFLHFPVPVEGYPVPEHGYAIAAGLVAPKSRGTLRLASSDPRVLPLADPKMLTDRDDRRAMVDAVQMCRDIGASKPFAPWRTGEVAPGPSVQSRAELMAFVRGSVATYFHPVGTCKMGAADDPDAVVGSDLRVRGVESLRVADASIMPTIPHGNTNAPTIMIGERAADLILGRAE
jgi:choline dehydrogenase